MKQNQIHLRKRRLESNKKFLEMLYTNPFVNANRWFDRKYDLHIEREIDADMTLDKFLTIMDKSFFIALQVASPIPTLIRYCASGKYNAAERFAWFECEATNNNYKRLREIFEQAYHQDIESIKSREL